MLPLEGYNKDGIMEDIWDIYFKDKTKEQIHKEIKEMLEHGK